MVQQNTLLAKVCTCTYSFWTDSKNEIKPYCIPSRIVPPPPLPVSKESVENWADENYWTKTIFFSPERSESKNWELIFWKLQNYGCGKYEIKFISSSGSFSFILFSFLQNIDFQIWETTFSLEKLKNYLIKHYIASIELFDVIFWIWIFKL